MAPVPKEANKPQDQNNMDESGAESFHNPNLTGTTVVGNSDSSDEEYEDMIAPGGYSLLPSEPGNHQDDSDSDSESGENHESDFNTHNNSLVLEGATSAEVPESRHLSNENVPDAVLSSEAESSSPTICDSEDMGNPAAREKYPYGKIPSYLHVPSLPRDKEGHLWNEKRTGEKKQTLDIGDESAILKAMSSFQLPPESIPAWAKNIPEDQWRQQVHSHIASYRDDTDAKRQSLSQRPEESTKVSTSDEKWVAEFPEDA